jgi:hypothetical protein
VFNVIRALQPLPPDTGTPRLFLAGGIGGCPHWQDDAIARLAEAGVPMTAFNPRREDYPHDDPAAEAEQVSWEFRALRASQVVLFWFTDATDQPIALFELGGQLARPVRLAVGAAPGYRRRVNLVTQLSLARPDLVVHDGLAGVVAAALTLLRD